MDSKFLTFIAVLLFSCSFIACGDDEEPIVKEPVVTSTVSDLYAPITSAPGEPPAGDFIGFNFKENRVVELSTGTWDIAFRGTLIIVNGGTQILPDEPARTGTGAASIVDGTFDEVLEAPANSLFGQDGPTEYAIPSGSDNGWYNYAGPPTFLISPLAGKILVIRTHDNNYAKMEILSYYKGAPASVDSTSEPRYFTFNFAYNPNGDKAFIDQ